MRMFINELHKLIHNRAFILVLISVFCLNIYIAFTTSADKYMPDSAYRVYFSDIEGMSLEEAREFTVSEIERASTTGEAVYTDYSWQDRNLLNDQLKRIDEIAGYKEYVESIKTTAELMTSVSIFADKNSFSYRNIVKTPPAYEAVNDVKPTFDPSDGVRLATDNPASDILTLFALIACASAIFYKDRESGITGLIKPLKYGRTHLALCKTVLVFATCLAIEASTFASNLALGAYRFGLGDIARPIQSVSGYIGCNLPISVAEMLLFSFVIKLFGLFVCAEIAQCLFIRLSNVVSYLCMIGITAVEVSLFLLVPETSVFSPLKQLNLAAFVSSSRLFRTYSNINFFGCPINLTVTSLICISLLAVGITLLTCKLYYGISISEVKRSSGFVMSKRVPKSLFSYTAHKSLVMHKGALILAAVLAIQVHTAVNYRGMYDSDDAHYFRYCTEISSMTDDEADRFILSEQERIDNTPSNGSYDTISEKRGFERARDQYEHTKSLGLHASDVFYQTGYRHIFGFYGLKTDYSLGLIAVIALCLALSPLISYDNRCRMGYVIYTTKAGKKTYFKHNMLMAFYVALAVSAFVYIPYLYQMLHFYGTAGIYVNVRCIAEMASLPNMPVFCYLAALIILRTIVLVAFSQLLIAISAKCQSATTAMIVTLAVFSLPIVVYLAGAEPASWLCLPVSINREVQFMLRLGS